MKKKFFNITVVGAGYVGMSLGVLLSQTHRVTILDILPLNVSRINSKKSTVNDKDIEKYLESKSLNLIATLDKGIAYKNADFVIIATPTDYDSSSNNFDTSSVDSVIEDLSKFESNPLIVIKSTVPVGYTDAMQKKFVKNKIIFSPEFLREGNALHDNLYPSRIIIGGLYDRARDFANLLQSEALNTEVKLIYMSPMEAEAVKLFSNTYLAMRIAFFNELDSYALKKDLNTMNVIEGVCSDLRIGSGYNNPSFGYGGYCLPKDTKQLLSNYDEIPQEIIKAVVLSNDTRKNFICNEIVNCNPKTVGIFRLVMKQGSDNFRSSAVLDIMENLKSKGIKIVIYEPSLEVDSFQGNPVLKSFNDFKKTSDLIMANRMSKMLEEVSDKVFSRDIYGND